MHDNSDYFEGLVSRLEVERDEVLSQAEHTKDPDQLQDIATRALEIQEEIDAIRGSYVE